MLVETPLVQLPQFEGPLELLLFLIKKDELNIYDIPISHITTRYLEALHHYQEMNLELGGEFLVMASTLMYIKSRMLLPKDGLEDEAEEGVDPRQQLVRQLLEFQMFQEAGEVLSKRDLLGTDTFHQPVQPEVPLFELEDANQPLAPIGLYDLIKKFKKALDRARDNVHSIEAEEVPLRKCIEMIIERLDETPSITFSELIANRWSLRELIVFFLATLELCRLKYLKVTQHESFGTIRLERNTATTEIDMSQLSWI